MLLIKQIYNTIFSHHVNKEPKAKKDKQQEGYSPDLAWVFITSDPSDPRAVQKCRTLKTIQYKAEENYYITSSGFYRNDKRDKNSVRWINTINLDFDNMDLLEVLDSIERAGLPYPSFLNRTPSGGYHAWYILNKPIRNGKNNKARVLVESIQRSMAREVEADMQAIGIERWWRVPHSNTVFLPTEYLETIDIEELITWREINCPEDKNTKYHIKSIKQKGILQQSLFVNLLKGVEDGQRNHACLTLALAMKWDKIELPEALIKLTEWNKLNSPQLPQRKLEKIVKGAYFSKSLGPSTLICRDIFGETFTYKSWTPTPAKPREERQRVHIDEWAEDIIEMLQKNNNTWEGSQRELASILEAPFRSIQEALKLLKESNKIDINIIGKGRAAKTCLTLVCVAENVNKEENTLPAVAGGENLYFSQSISINSISKNSLKLMTHTDNNTLDTVVGGSPPT